MKTTKIRKQKLVHEKHTLNDKQIFFFPHQFNRNIYKNNY